ncbi:AfsR/SARP family transcriptional regulator [Streptomyces alkaliterrae]|uniref:AAA family ATPase n=1 Tax=Streptomyces alkaliterrae TaxID=2213162 RepID=A0A5P0YQK8_9ACTN|nr:BTAD domain-containing putative transcriptional regulator [Streptomyces alkaliterrae]MBB1260645.1 AfsR/SARP family transcriptional regulator [Streptomyces alkaliterrae]MQS02596.1 AAA family ATPase [Streptomyces alkaliterrae]
MCAHYEFRMLGPLDVRRNGRPVPIGAAKLRLLLAALLAEAGSVVPVDNLVDVLWRTDPPTRTRNTLQNYVLRLRRCLGPEGHEVVLTHPRGYLAEIDPDSLDLHRFRCLVRQGREVLESDGPPDRSAALLREALGLWRGEPLSDLPEGALQAVLTALAEQRLDALELRIEADLASGRAAAVLPELRALVDSHPLRERFWAQRILALYRCGRQAEALECYRTVAALLSEELGIDPGAELRDLQRRMLTAAAELDAPEVRRWRATDGPESTAAEVVPPVPVPGAASVSATSERVAPGPAGQGSRVSAESAAWHGVPAGGSVRTGGNLPAETTTFIGRKAELAEARRALHHSRLLTLTGVGGVGKTRLALRLADQVASCFSDGAWLADLAPLTDPALLDRAVAESLGLRDQSPRHPADVMADHLRDRVTLLVLDNCEHLVEPVAALVMRLLRAAPGLRILATSRERLGVPGEHVLLVPSLSLPPENAEADPGAHAEPGAAECSEAVLLLAGRAAASCPGFRVTEHNRGPVEQLCRRLDGIPLAIELAAVRLGSMAVAEVLSRLDDCFRLLSMPRGRADSRYQQTLRGVVDWSYSLCTEGERLLWIRLSVFSDGFDLEAAEAVCDGEGIACADVLDLLAGLVQKSIVMVDSNGSRARYRLLETIRQYGRQRLLEQGGTTALALRHSDHYHALTVRAAAEWCGPAEVDWLCRLRGELPNLRAALDFCRTHPGRAGVGLEIAVNLTRTRCWFFSSTLGEGRHWLERLHDPSVALPDELTASRQALKAWIALCQGDLPGVRAAMEECRAAPGPTRAPAMVYIEGAHALLVSADPDAIAQLERARSGFRQAGHHGDAHMATMLWAIAAAFLGDRHTAFHARDVYLAEAETARAEWAWTWARWCAGLAELRHGKPALALPLLREALACQRSIGDRWGPVWGVETLAWAVAAVGRPTCAAVLLGAAHRMQRAIGVALTGLRPFHLVHAETEGLVRGTLGAAAYADAWARGLAAQDSIGLALSAGEEFLTARPPHGSSGPQDA